MPCVGLQCGIVVFTDHTHLLLGDILACNIYSNCQGSLTCCKETKTMPMVHNKCTPKNCFPYCLVIIVVVNIGIAFCLFVLILYVPSTIF